MKSLAQSLALVLVLGWAALSAQEKLVLTTPVFVSTGADFRVLTLNLSRTYPNRPASILAIYSEVAGTAFLNGGRTIVCRYDGTEAETLIIALNKVNLSTISLEKRVTQRCQMDGKLGAGTITGNPE